VARSERGESSGLKQGYRILDGYDAVAEWLRAGVGGPGTVVTGAPVARVRWRRGEVEALVRSDGSGAERMFRARAAVVTLPLGVLQTGGGPVFEPEPPGKRRALEGLAMGPALRLVLRFREVWWEPDDPDAGELLGFLHLPEAPIPTWWTAAPLRAPLLTGWAGGPAAARLAGCGTDALVEAGLEALAGAFSEPRARLEALLVGAYSHDWSADPYSRWSHNHVLVGGAAQQAALAAPVEDTLFYAGEATHTGGEHGSVHGAIATGYRAAHEVLSRFGLA